MDITYNELYELMELVDENFQNHSDDLQFSYGKNIVYIHFWGNRAKIYILYYDNNKLIYSYEFLFTFYSFIEITLLNYEEDRKTKTTFIFENISFDKATFVADFLLKRNLIKTLKQKSALSVVR